MTSVAAVAGSPVLLIALDVDGTLAPLQDDPMAVRVIPAAQAAIARLAALPDTHVAYVSGRSLEALRIITEHDDGSPIRLAGSHGAEQWAPGGAAPAAGAPADVAAIRAAAEHAVAAMPWARIEQKTLGLAVHTRGAAPDAAAAAQAAVAEVMAAHAPGWRHREGKDVREYSWRHEGKDTAVADLRAAVGATAVLFAGDDVTDEDALKTLGPDDLGVHVGDKPTAATVTVGDIAALADLLTVLATERTRARE